MSELIKTSVDEQKFRQMIRSEIDPLLGRLDELVTPSQTEFLGVKEISELLGLEESTIYSLTSRRKIPHYKPGKKLLFRKDEIEHWILEHRCSDVNSSKSNYQNRRS